MLLKMKKKLNWFICLAIGVFAFAACSDDDDNGGSEEGKGTIKSISVQVDKGNTFSSLIDSVFVELSWDDDYDWGSEIITCSAYKGGNFTLELPNEMDDLLLEPIYDEEEEDDDDFMQHMTISNKSARTAAFQSLDAYNKKDGVVGEITRSSVNLSALQNMEDIDELMSILSKGVSSVMYMYVDRDVTIKGSYTEKDEEIMDGIYGDAKYSANLSLQKGWNVVALKETMQINMAKETMTISAELTSSVPSGLKWFFNDYSYDYDYDYDLRSSADSGTSKSTPNFKLTPLFKKSKASKLFR